MGVELGHRFRGAFKKQTNAWAGKALQLGSGDGFEFVSESLTPNSALVVSEGVSGRAYRRPGLVGNVTPGGDVNFDLYYRDTGSHRIVAQGFGLDTVTALGGGAQQHDLTIQNTLAGIFGTLVLAGDEGVKEAATAKLSSLKFSWKEGEQLGKLVASFLCHDYNLNVGTPNDAFVVASVAAANGALTITAGALADFVPSPLFITKDAGVTAITAVIVAVDKFGFTYTRTVVTADFVSNVWTDTEYTKRVISITLSGVTGAGNIKVGVTNGVNNNNTVSAITTVTERDFAVFTQAEILMNAQSAGALSASTDKQYVSGFEIGVDLKMDQRVTTQYGNRIEEPALGGAGRPVVTFGMNHSAFTDKNRQRLFDQVAKGMLKARIRLAGPIITGSAVQHAFEFYLNNIQFADGYDPVGGPGVLPFDLSGEANDATAVPTGFPAGVDEPLMLRIVNGDSTPYV